MRFDFITSSLANIFLIRLECEVGVIFGAFYTE
jgi:hypothetical protein